MSACALCGNPAAQKCNRCKVTYYCSREHQQQDWKTHKVMCTPPDGSSDGQTKKKTANEGSRLGQMTTAEKKANIFTDQLRYETIAVGEGGETLECGVVMPLDYAADKTYPVCIAISGERQRHVSRYNLPWVSFWKQGRV